MTTYHRLRKLFIVITIAVLLTGCIKVDTELIGESIRSKVVNIAGNKKCSDVSLSAAKGKPLDKISLSVVPSDMEEVLAIQVESMSNDNNMLIPALRHDEEEGATFQIPLHPNGSIKGGKVAMTLIDDVGATCKLAEFTIEALKKSEGAFEELVTLIEEVNEEQKKILNGGQPRTSDLAAINEVTTSLPGDIVDGITHGADNPNSLDKVINGEAPTSGEITDAQWEVIDSLVDQSGILDEMGQLKDDLKETAKAVEADKPSNDKPSSFACDITKSKPSASTLSMLMRFQKEGEDLSKYNELMDATSLFLGGASVVAASTVLGAGYAFAFTAVGSAIFAVQTIAGGMDGLFPSEMVSLDVDLNPTEFLEDDELLNGTWEKAELMTKSKGFNIGKAALGAMLQIAGVKSLGGLDKKWMTKFAKVPMGEGLQGLHDLTINSYTNEIINQATQGSDIAQIPPCDFGPTDITDKEWSKAQFVDADNAPVWITDHGKYEAISTGKALLEVEPIKEKFGGRFIIGQESVFVEPIKVTIDPTSYRGEPGETVVFTATIENANNDDVKWSISPQGNHQYTVSKKGNGTSVITIQTSENPADYPATVRVESTSSTGLRSYPDAPPRFAEALLGGEHANVVIEPGYSCVKPEEKQTFSASVSGTNNEKVTWAVSGGTISSDGVFTAPEKAGNYSITATSVADPKANSTVEVTVGSCVCVNELKLTEVGVNKASLYVKGHSPSQRSEVIILSDIGIKESNLRSRIVREGELLDDSLAEISLYKRDEGNEDFNGRLLRVVFPKNQGPMPGDVGTFDAEIQFRFFYYYGSKVEVYHTNDDKVNPVTVRIEEFVQGKEPHEAMVKGVIEGPLKIGFNRSFYNGDYSSENNTEIRMETNYRDLSVNLSVPFQGYFIKTITNDFDFFDDPNHDKWDRRPMRILDCQTDFQKE